MSPAGSESDTNPFNPGDVFASRYRMINRLGQRGLGEVWRADDLVLHIPVALKLIRATSRAGRERILNEVRLARQITHPAVCRVFDVGEAGNGVFYSMELVQGEDLAILLGRVGRLPSEKVIDIGRQLCAGLATAHAQGVLHRDLTLGNVLVAQDGSVRMIEFGFASAHSDTDTSTDTPADLAPEQRAPGAALSEQTDLYALGAILYELVVGVRPFHDRSSTAPMPPRPSTLVPDVDPQLERVVMQALAPDPRDRPASASAMAANLLGGEPLRSRRRAPRWAAPAAVAALAIVVAALSSWFIRREPRALTDHDIIVIADFMNTTGEPVFDGALKVALAVALEQSPFLRVFPDDRVRETLRLMQRADDVRVTRAIAREIAQREQLKALVAGSIGSLGSHYVVALEAINADTGDVMAREQVEVSAKEQVLTSLGTATSRLREKLGESLASIQKFDAPLPRATTSSLEALHAYALALDQGRVNLRREAIPHLQRAIELDPSFAMAQALLSGIYANTGQHTEAPAFSRRAFELRDRVSERERFFISWRYYVDAAQAWDKALELAQAWTTTYPREAFALNSLGIASGTFGQLEQAVRAFQEAIRLDPRFVPPHGNLVGSLIALNRFPEAKARLREAGDRGVDFISLRRMAYVLAFLDGDSAGMARELDLLRGTPNAMWASTLQGRTAVFSGRFHAAHALFQQGVQAAVRDNFRELGAQWMMEDAESHAIAGQCPEARREIRAGLELSRDNFTLERANRTLVWCGADEGAGLSGELADRFSSATITTRIQLPVAAAAFALRRGEPARALERLEAVTSYDWAPASELWPAYLRGQAALALKDGGAAAAQFRTLLAHRGSAPTSPLYPLAQLGLARAAALAGDVGEARMAYEAFFAFWTGADAGLQPVEEARAEFARLR
jgi:tetratricopeptide (TPR) repeat protein/tRNA A-37 threonylcarbamoyl transferase component Bud32